MIDLNKNMHRLLDAPGHSSVTLRFSTHSRLEPWDHSPEEKKKKSRKEWVSARTLGPEGGWIVMSHISWGGEQTTIYKSVETFP